METHCNGELCDEIECWCVCELCHPASLRDEFAESPSVDSVQSADVVIYRREGDDRWWIHVKDTDPVLIERLTLVGASFGVRPAREKDGYTWVLPASNPQKTSWGAITFKRLRERRFKYRKAWRGKSNGN